MSNPGRSLDCICHYDSHFQFSSQFTKELAWKSWTMLMNSSSVRLHVFHKVCLVLCGSTHTYNFIKYNILFLYYDNFEYMRYLRFCWFNFMKNFKKFTRYLIILNKLEKSKSKTFFIFFRHKALLSRRRTIKWPVKVLILFNFIIAGLIFC